MVIKIITHTEQLRTDPMILLFPTGHAGMYVEDVTIHSPLKVPKCF